MTVRLIPVIEINCRNQGVQAPDKYPYWNNSEIWDRYREENYLKAGFKDKLPAYLPGSSFHRPTDITDNNLIKLVLEHTEGMRTGEYERNQACALFGGYVLQVDGQDEYYPQCCGQLSDIIYWERLAEGKNSYYEGHPAPQIKFENDTVILDLSVKELDEPFQPTPNKTELKVAVTALKNAVEMVKVELEKLAERLIKINQDVDLKITDIDKLLIWEDGRHE